MPDDPRTTLQKHKQNVLHSERRIAETAVVAYNIVKVGSADWQVVPATANSVNLGVALNSVSAADITAYAAGGDIAAVECEVAMIGVVPVLAGGELTAAGFVRSDGSARAVAVAADGTDNIIGKVLKDASGAGVETHMLIVYSPAVD